MQQEAAAAAAEQLARVRMPALLQPQAPESQLTLAGMTHRKRRSGRGT